MFAKRRIIRANGFEKIPINSTGIMIGKSQNGTPGAAKICFQYVLLPLKLVISIVNNARTNVRAILPVTFAPNGGGKGIRPIRLLIRMKKNTDNRYGMNFS